MQCVRVQPLAYTDTGAALSEVFVQFLCPLCMNFSLIVLAERAAG
jgi:hypothetical protein